MDSVVVASHKRRFFLKICLVIITLVPILIVAVYGYIQAYRNITTAVISKRETIAYLAAQTLDEKLDHVIDIGRLEVSRPAVIDTIKRKKWNDAILLISSLRQEAPYIDRIVLEDPKGILVSDDPHAVPSLVGSDFSNSLNFQTVIKTGKPYIGAAVKRLAAPQVNVVPIIIPILSIERPEKVVAILFLQIKVDQFLEWSKNISQGQESVYFVDQKGRVLGHPLYGSKGKLIDYSKLPPEENVLAGKKGIEEFYNPIEKQKKLVAYYPIKEYKWGAVVSESAKSAFAQRQAELRRIIGIFAFGVLMAVVLLYFVFKYGTQLGFSEEKERVLLESIGDGIFAINKKRQITLWNKAAENITGWTYHDAIGKTYTDVVKFIQEENHHEATSYIDHVLKTGKPDEMKLHTVLIRRDGKKIPVGDSASPIFDRSRSSVEGVIVVFRDATQERNLERSKDEFVSIAAHQLRTPLGIIRWSIESMYKKTKLQATKTKLKDILDTDLNLIKIVNDLLNISRINQGKVEIKMEEINLSEYVSAAISEVENIAKESEVKITKGDLGKDIHVLSDKNMLSQVLRNVLGNAIKYNKKKGTVTVSIQKIENAVEITISDTGIGIPEEDKDIIFDTFVRGRNVKNIDTEGTGLGLHIVQEYMRLMNGTVALKSTEGKGTIVTLTLTKAI